MGEIVLYHGSFNKVVVPQYGLGETKHDYGKGFYLTENVELAKEWAVCRPDETNGWVHKFELDTKDLKVLDFQQYNVLSWLAELMKHRDAADTRRYKMLSKKFIAKDGINDFLWIGKIDIEIIEELLSLGGLGIQYCIKSELAYSKLTKIEDGLICVDYNEFNEKYNKRDINARKNMHELVDSDINKVTNVFSTLI